jgi:hypothetical protein
MPTGSRITLPGSGGTGDTAGDVWTTTAIDKLSGGVISRNFLTSTVSNVGAAGGSAYVFMQCAATLNSNRLIRIAFHCGNLQKGAGGSGRIKIRLLFDSTGGTSWTVIRAMFNQTLSASDITAVDSFAFLNSSTYGGVNFGLDALVVTGTGDIAAIGASTGGYDGTVSDPGAAMLVVEDCGPWF